MNRDDPDEGYDETSRGPSKSQAKRDSSALQDLARELLALSGEQLERLHLPVEVFDAICVGQRISAHGALRRQQKLIGKLLRRVEADPIRERFAALKNESVAAVRVQHRCEAWRDRMLLDGDGAVDDFLQEYPEADRRKLRQWVRDGQRERNAGLPPRAARLLFRYLRETLSASDPTVDDEHGRTDHEL